MKAHIKSIRCSFEVAVKRLRWQIFLAHITQNSDLQKLNHCSRWSLSGFWPSVWTSEPLETWAVIFNCYRLKISFKGGLVQSDRAHEAAHGFVAIAAVHFSSCFSKGLAKAHMKVWSQWEVEDLLPPYLDTCLKFHYIQTLLFKRFFFLFFF